jgi:hypothetical protein
VRVDPDRAERQAAEDPARSLSDELYTGEGLAVEADSGK